MRKYLLNVFLYFFSLSLATGQACFTANVTRGCAPLTVNMIDCSGVNDIYYKYTDGGSFSTATSHTYTEPGLYTVTQQVCPLSNCYTLVRTDYIEVIAPRKPTYKLEVCEGYKVKLTANDNIDTAYYVKFTFGGPNFLLKPNDTQDYLYADPAIQTISITPTSASCYFLTDTTFYPLNFITKPDISRVIVNNQNSTNGQITVRFNAEISQRYYLQQNINNFGYINIDTLVNLSGSQSYIINNLNTISNKYCYRLIAFDDCSSPTKVSEEICSFQNTVTPQNNYNDISWIDPGNVNVYHIFKNNVEIAISGTTSYIDNAVNCGVDYCYFIKAELNFPPNSLGNLESISDTVCVTAISTSSPTAIQNLNSSILSNKISLSWNKPVGFSVQQYNISRSVNGGALTLGYSNTDTTNFSDSGVRIPENTYCYQINYKDTCGNSSSTSSVITTCPIILNVSIDNNNNMLNHLTWSGYIGDWPLGINGYRIEKLDENNNIIAIINVNSSFNFDDLIVNTNSQVIKYRIKAVANGPDTLTISYSNIVEIKYEGAIYLPNAFTPDGDGINDLFFAKGRFIKDFRLSIFNRWGEVVYSTEDFNEGWNGTYQGSTALNDAYAYLVDATDLWGKKLIKRGSVTLLR